MGYGLVLWFLHRKIRPTQLWVELSWVVATKTMLPMKWGAAQVALYGRMNYRVNHFAEGE